MASPRKNTREETKGETTTTLLQEMMQKHISEVANKICRVQQAELEGLRARLQTVFEDQQHRMDEITERNGELTKQREMAEKAYKSNLGMMAQLTERLNEAEEKLDQPRSEEGVTQQRKSNEDDSNPRNADQETAQRGAFDLNNYEDDENACKTSSCFGKVGKDIETALLLRLAAIRDVCKRDKRIFSRPSGNLAYRNVRRLLRLVEAMEVKLEVGLYETIRGCHEDVRVLRRFMQIGGCVVFDDRYTTVLDATKRMLCSELGGKGYTSQSKISGEIITASSDDTEIDVASTGPDSNGDRTDGQTQSSHVSAKRSRDSDTAIEKASKRPRQV